MFLSTVPFIGLWALAMWLLPSASLPLVLIVLFAISTYLAFTPTVIVVGDDGVSIGWLGRTRFFAFADLQDVRKQRVGIFGSRHDRVTLLLAGGTPVEVAFGLINGPSTEFIDVVQKGIAGAVRTATRHPVPVAPWTVGGPTATWLPELERSWLGGSYRDGAIDGTTPWDIVEHPLAHPLDRAVAAYLLARSSSDHTEQFMKLAHSTAEPHLQALLRALARGETAAARGYLGKLAARRSVYG